MEKRYSIREVLEDNSKLDNYFGFYDWFCSDAVLEKRAKALLAKLKFLVKEKLVNPDTNYVWFKNNCPMNGSLYDDLRISTLDENEDFLGGFCPRIGHKFVDDKCSFWVLKPEFTEYTFKDWSTFKKRVKTDDKLRNKIKEAFGKGL